MKDYLNTLEAVFEKAEGILSDYADDSTKLEEERKELYDYISNEETVKIINDYISSEEQSKENNIDNYIDSEENSGLSNHYIPFLRFYYSIVYQIIHEITMHVSSYISLFPHVNILINPELPSTFSDIRKCLTTINIKISPKTTSSNLDKGKRTFKYYYLLNNHTKENTPLLALKKRDELHTQSFWSTYASIFLKELDDFQVKDTVIKQKLDGLSSTLPTFTFNQLDRGDRIPVEIDSDIIDYFKDQSNYFGISYHDLINQCLREVVQENKSLQLY
jgi:predicted DNA binding CopG/RHH family protein